MTLFSDTCKSAETQKSDETWKCPPRVMDLPRHSRLGITCKSCGHSWSEAVGDMRSKRHMGGLFLDLLEFEYRCQKPGCGGRVAFTCENPDFHTLERPVTYAQTLNRPPRGTIQAQKGPRVALKPKVSGEQLALFGGEAGPVMRQTVRAGQVR